MKAFQLKANHPLAGGPGKQGWTGAEAGLGRGPGVPMWVGLGAWTDWQIDTTENITFPQLRWQVSLPNTLLIFVAVVSVTLTKGLITSLQAMAAEPFNTDDIELKYKSKVRNTYHIFAKLDFENENITITYLLNFT